MEPVQTAAALAKPQARFKVLKISLAQLVGEVYAAAPAPERRRLLAYLLRPLGVLALVSIADGIFAKILFRGGAPDLQVQPDDVNRIRSSDISALVDRVQQVSVDAVDGLASIVAASPMMATSAAAAVLVAVLIKRASTRRAAQLAWGGDPDFEPPR